MPATDMPPGRDPELWALVAPLLAAKNAQGLSFGMLGVRLRCHRTHVSRALSARILPDRDRLLRIAHLLGVDESAVGRQWDRAAASRRDHRARQAADTAAGAPPDRLASHDDLMGALQDLLDRRRISHRELERLDPELRRSTVGAVLRGDRGVGRDQVAAIVRACGVLGEAARAWEDAWTRLSLPDLHRRYERGRAWLKARQVPRHWLYRR